MAVLLLSTLAWLYGFWALFVLVMGFYRAHLAGRLVGVTKVLAYPIVAAGIAVDFVTQYTLATMFFLDSPASGEYLVTSRLQRYVAQGEGWRYRFAKAVCDGILDPFDPSGEHC